MKTIDKIITKMDCKYGAPMGRANIGSYPNQITVFDCAVPMDNSGAYDRGGAYWGIGSQLRVKYTKDLSYIEFYKQTHFVYGWKEIVRPDEIDFETE